MPIISTYPDFVHKEQQHVIGEEHEDRLGDLWDYVEFAPGTYKEGQLVRDQTLSDFISGGEGTASAAAAVGTNVLQDTGEFANKDLRGAIGVITDGGGVGQTFQVIAHKGTAGNELIIAVNGSDKTNRGWKTALTTASKYKLRIPGRVELAGAGDYDVRGAVQYEEEFTVPSGEFRYGYVRKTGIGQGLLDANGAAVQSNNLLIPAASGLLIGVPSTLTIVALSHVIGKSVLGDLDADIVADTLIPVDFKISSNGRSYRQPITRENPTFTVK